MPQLTTPAATMRSGVTHVAGNARKRGGRRQCSCLWPSIRAKPISSTGANETVVARRRDDEGEGVRTCASVTAACSSSGPIRAGARRWCSTPISAARLPGRRMPAWHLRQHEHGGGRGLHGPRRQYNRRFLQLCSHYLVEPTACTPAAGWEKGQVENQSATCGSASSPDPSLQKLQRVELLAGGSLHRCRPRRRCIPSSANARSGMSTRTRSSR